MLRSLRGAFINLELLWFELLSFLETRQLILHLLLPGEYFKPVEFLDGDTFRMEQLSAHSYLDLCLS